MIDTDMLREIIKQSGLKYGHIANRLNLTTYGLQKKIENSSEFKASEIREICDILMLTLEQRDKVFFTLIGDKLSRNPQQPQPGKPQ